MNKMTDHIERFMNAGIEDESRGFGVVNPLPDKMGIIIRDQRETYMYSKATRKIIEATNQGRYANICPETRNKCPGSQYEEVFKNICDGNSEGCSPEKVNDLIVQLTIAENWMYTKFKTKK